MAVRTLLVVALILNGMAMPPAAAMPAAADMSSHASHHQPAPSPDVPPAHHSSSTPGGDCCDGMGCDCGCAVPQAVTLSISPPQVAWQVAFTKFAFVVKSFTPTPLAAPFRPPA